jgi:hypothetical protein
MCICLKRSRCLMIRQRLDPFQEYQDGKISFGAVTLPASRDDVSDTIAFARINPVDSVGRVFASQAAAIPPRRRRATVSAIGRYQFAEAIKRQTECFAFPSRVLFRLVKQSADVRFTIRQRLASAGNTATATDGLRFKQHLGNAFAFLPAFAFAKPNPIPKLLFPSRAYHGQVSDCASGQILGGEACFISHALWI